MKIFKVYGKSVGLFNVRYDEEKNYDLVVLVRKKFPHLVIEAISPKCILGYAHAKKIIAVSLYAQKHRQLLSKKLQTDILLRFAVTTQISQAIKTAGIKKHSNFVIVAIGTKRSLVELADFITPHLAYGVDYKRNAEFLQKQFGISKKHFGATISKTALEDLMVERATVLFQ